MPSIRLASVCLLSLLLVVPVQAQDEPPNILASLNDATTIVRKDVEDAKLPWIILSEALTEKAGEPRQLHFYAIRAVPTMVLVDKEGKIIMTRAQGDALKTKLTEIFE